MKRLLDPELIESLKGLQLSARRVVAGATTGIHRSPLRGASVEFRQHRFYVPGDEPRHLDWRVLGRTDRPYVKEFDHETNLRCMLLVDRSGSMAYARQFGSKLQYATRLAAALAYLMLGQTESVGLSLFSQKTHTWIKPHPGRGQLSRIVDALERVAPAGPSGVEAAMHEAAERLERRALVLVVSDFFSPVAEIRRGLAHLAHERHEVVAIQVIDRDEEQFPFTHSRRFRGLEGEPAYLCDTGLVREAYLANFQAHQQEFREACQATEAEYELFLTDRPLVTSLTQLLLRRGGTHPAPEE